MPKLERKADPPKKKEKVPKAAPGAAPATAAGKEPKQPKVGASDATPAADAAPKKEKKEKKEAKDKGANADGGAAKKAGGKNAPAAEDAGEPVPSMIDLRVGHIVDSTSLLFLR